MRSRKQLYKYLRYTKSFHWSEFLLEHNIPIRDFAIDKKTGSVFIRPVAHSFKKGEYPVFFQGYAVYAWKFLNNGFEFVFNDQGFFVRIKELLIRIDTLEELYIINEVFIENTYRIETTASYVAFDIGMNVGITSLFLSQSANVTKIYSFEPFGPTFKCAEENILRNPATNGKISFYNYGLSDADKTISLPYDSSNKGNVGIKNIEGNSGALQTIELKNAAASLGPLIARHAGERIVAKIDCEGSEYDIIESLEKEELLPAFDILMIEWHALEGYKQRLLQMIESFKKNNFQVICVGSLDHEAGMLYCFKAAQPANSVHP
ncbi:MAG: methyltransferase, FkbM family [Ferruginibacter sp.]|nr:methyltransferase, FkbM family [Ferruginibacter sp.]